MCGKSDNLTPSSTCSCSDKPSPRVFQADDTMGRLGTAAAAGAVAGTAAGAIHNVLTSLYRNITLRKVIAYAVHKNNELGDAINKSELLLADKVSIKDSLNTINDILNSVSDKIEDPRTQFRAINAKIEFIKGKLDRQMPELMQWWGQAYFAIGPAVYNADSGRIHQQSVGAGLAVGVGTLLGSVFANDIQTAFEYYFNPSQLGAVPVPTSNTNNCPYGYIYAIDSGRTYCTPLI
jgi:hypothetical protein